MPTPIKYDEIHLYSRYASIDSANIRTYLDNNNIKYIELQYPIEQVAEAIAPLNTWFDDGKGGRVQFADFPIITFDEVYWIADDATDRYTKRTYATQTSALPSDFLSKAEKKS
jgi:hypothetical protein